MPRLRSKWIWFPAAYTADQDALLGMDRPGTQMILTPPAPEPLRPEDVAASNSVACTALAHTISQSDVVMQHVSIRVMYSHKI